MKISPYADAHADADVDADADAGAGLDTAESDVGDDGGTPGGNEADTGSDDAEVSGGEVDAIDSSGDLTSCSCAAGTRSAPFGLFLLTPLILLRRRRESQVNG